MRNLLKLKLRAVLWTEFFFEHALGYFQILVKKKISLFLAHPNIQGEAHKVLQSDSTQTIDHIQKCFR